jgi:2-polyprenyl-3-methyl-5-hydroxy-6-metoxy-1,4-benzoquinol methylase
MSLNRAKLHVLLARVFHDLAAAQSAALVDVGDRLGLYRALVRTGATTAAGLAGETGVDERYVEAWLLNQAAGGYVEHDAGAGTFRLTEEQAEIFAREDSDVFLVGAFQFALGTIEGRGRVTAAFRRGLGVPADAFSPDVREGIERSFGVRHGAQLLASWLPALDGVMAKLDAGAHVADVGCGGGSAVLTLARAFPKSRFVGLDPHRPSIERARRRADELGLSATVRFDETPASTLARGGFDLIMSLDTLHEVGDPVSIARHVREALAPDGAWLVAEPLVAERTEDNLNLTGRLASAAAALYCLPVARAEGGGSGVLGGARWVRDLLLGAGFTRVRRLPDAPMALVFDARA